MTITAPPRPPHPSDPIGREEIEALEALIEEARQRTRRRRRKYAAVTVLLAVIGVALSIVFARPGPTADASLGCPPRPPLPTPTKQQASSPSTGIFSWAGFSCTPTGA